MGPRNHMADPLLDWRGPTLGMRGSEGRGPMQRRAAIRVGGKDGKEEKGASREWGFRGPHPFLPACLVCSGLHSPDNWSRGDPPALCAGCGPKRPVWDPERWEGQVTPKARPTHLSKLRACGGGAERGRRACGEQSQGLPTPPRHCAPPGIGPHLRACPHSVGQHLLQGSDREGLLQDEATNGQIGRHVLGVWRSERRARRPLSTVPLRSPLRSQA